METGARLFRDRLLMGLECYSGPGTFFVRTSRHSFITLLPAKMHRRNPTLMGSLPSLSAPSPPLYAQFPLSKLPSSPRTNKHATSSSSLLSKQWLPRTTFLALFSLFFVCIYVLLIAGPSRFRPVTLAAPPPPSSFRDTLNNLADANSLWKSSHKDIIASRPQISLTPEQELAAVSSFIISLPSQNVIPSSVDPLLPIDPQLVLDFDTRADGAYAELTQLIADVWDTNPVVIYSKTSAATRELRATIDSYNLHPPPVIIDLQGRADAEVLEPLLRRVTSSPLPILLVHGMPIDVSTLDRVKLLSQSGTLRRIITQAGAIIDGGKRKKGRK